MTHKTNCSFPLMGFCVFVSNRLRVESKSTLPSIYIRRLYEYSKRLEKKSIDFCVTLTQSDNIDLCLSLPAVTETLDRVCVPQNVFFPPLPQGDEQTSEWLWLQQTQMFLPRSAFIFHDSLGQSNVIFFLPVSSGRRSAARSGDGRGAVRRRQQVRLPSVPGHDQNFFFSS